MTATGSTKSSRDGESFIWRYLARGYRTGASISPVTGTFHHPCNDVLNQY